MCVNSKFLIISQASLTPVLNHLPYGRMRPPSHARHTSRNVPFPILDYTYTTPRRTHNPISSRRKHRRSVKHVHQVHIYTFPEHQCNLIRQHPVGLTELFRAVKIMERDDVRVEKWPCVARTGAYGERLEHLRCWTSRPIERM